MVTLLREAKNRALLLEVLCFLFGEDSEDSVAGYGTGSLDGPATVLHFHWLRILDLYLLLRFDVVSCVVHAVAPHLDLFIHYYEWTVFY